MSLPRRRWVRRLGVIGLLVLVALVGYLFRGFLLPHAARFLDVSEAPARVDYVMVLGGGAETRPFVAAALVKAGKASQVLVPQMRRGPESEHGIFQTDSEVICRVLIARGVPADAIILLPGEVASTADEASVLAQFLEGRPECTVGVITTTYHTRRARGVFHAILGARASRVRFVGAPTDDFDENNWWQTEKGFRCYLNEYVKLGYYWVSY